MQKLVERGQSVDQAFEESNLVENAEPYQWTDKDIVILTKEESELVWRQRSGGRMRADGGSPVVLQPDLTVMDSIASKAITTTIVPAVVAANGSQKQGPIHMSAAANWKLPGRTISTGSEGPITIIQTSTESEDILKNLLNYEDDPFLSEIHSQEVEIPSCYTNESIPAFIVTPSPVKVPVTKSDHVRSPKSQSSSASSTCTCCEEHQQNSQELVEKFTVAVDAMNQSISLAAQAIRGAMDVSLDALGNVTKALQEQTVAFHQFQLLTNTLIKSIGVRTLSNSTEPLGNNSSIKENKVNGRNEEKIEYQENKTSSRRRENSSEKKYLKPERRHHPY
ncbi:hypothetical protein ACJMK2_009086 [Sinanodonta woodiana]|uniref:Uncharacterized protein n=1 Tax=Sinanodonta woodiana TaxID=1069815 RepID=A0ABD3VE85_SINWO